MTRNLPESDEPQATDPLKAQDLTGADDAHILAEFHRVLKERHLYRDPDLTLERLARRVGIPGRQISQAVNRRLGRNVSQEINWWRIREAQALLEQSDRSVTEIMFECGFSDQIEFQHHLPPRDGAFAQRLAPPGENGPQCGGQHSIQKLGNQASNFGMNRAPAPISAISAKRSRRLDLLPRSLPLHPACKAEGS